MADSDFNVIKPVESLQQVQGLAPTSRREERKRRRKEPPPRQEREAESDETADTQTPVRDNDAHAIDYCA